MARPEWGRGGPKRSSCCGSWRVRHPTRRPWATAMPPKRRSRFRQWFVAHLLQVKGPLFLATLCTLGVAAAELIRPWPLKLILDNVVLNKPLPPALGFLQSIAGAGRVRLLVEASASIALIALAGGLFSYFQIFITSSIGSRMVYALRRELFAHLQTLSLAFHNRS